ncbi:MAG: glycoside hydrolase family 2 TIM barrel-domain containing protein [Pseudomonadota bacterium]
MLRTQRTETRDYVEVSGLWGFAPDPKGELGPDALLTHELAVPGSWNEQLAEAGFMAYVGAAWLTREVFVPQHFSGRRIVLRFGSAGYTADVYANGEQAGEGRLPYLPFEADVTSVAVPGEVMRIAVRVSNEEHPDGITPGVSLEDYRRWDAAKAEYFPATRPDFYPYGGLHRPVYLMALPEERIEAIRVETALEGSSAEVSVEAVHAHDAVLSAELSLRGEVVASGEGAGKLTLAVESAELWAPESPTLYDLELRLVKGGELLDVVRQKVGIRTIDTRGHEILLNGKPIFLKGFGRHEDSDVAGRALNLPVMVKDFGLMEWVGANSFRTSHYPYAEEQLEWADRHGVLVISEIASVNLDFRQVSHATRVNHFAAIEAQMARDRNHPSVIMWSLANEPGYLGENEYRRPEAADYMAAIFAHARSLDSSRLLTHANVQYAGIEDSAFEHSDVIGINRYRGWYDSPAQIERGVAHLKEELDTLTQHGKPICIWEFGADAVHGEHATYDQMFTEDFQRDFIEAQLDLFESHPAVAGAHIWNLCDFMTAQHHRRVVVNRKGVFTRDRKPKRAAFMLRKRWSGDA